MSLTPVSRLAIEHSNQARSIMKKTEHAKIEVTKDGPYVVSGALPLSEQWIVTHAEGDSLDYREGKKYPAQP